MASSFEKSRCFILPRVSFCPGLPYIDSILECDLLDGCLSKRHEFHCYVLFVVCLRVTCSISGYKSMNGKQSEPENWTIYFVWL